MSNIKITKLYIIVIVLLLLVIIIQSCDVRVGNKHAKNPIINHTYDKEEGDYFDIVKKDLINMNINLRDHHYKHFPIKYWVGPMDSDWDEIVRDAINDFDDFFPMKKIKNKKEAQLVIEISDFETIKSKFPNIPNDHVSGVGGLISIQPSNILTPITNLFHKKPATKGIVLLLPHAFEQPLISKAIILHELTHAFGVSAHSNDPYDLMYKDTNSSYEIESSFITVNGITQTIEDANKLSVRDLNTLWLLYNEW